MPLINRYDSFYSSIEETTKANPSLPARKKAKNERGTIMSFFNNKKADSTTEPKETKARTRSRSTTKRPKKNDPQPPINPTTLSSVHVEKTSLILFDEVYSFIKYKTFFL